MCTFKLHKTVIKHIDKFKKHCLWRGADLNAKHLLKLFGIWHTVRRDAMAAGHLHQPPNGSQQLRCLVPTQLAAPGGCLASAPSIQSRALSP